MIYDELSTPRLNSTLKVILLRVRFYDFIVKKKTTLIGIFPYRYIPNEHRSKANDYIGCVKAVLVYMKTMRYLHLITIYVLLTADNDMKRQLQIYTCKKYDSSTVKINRDKSKHNKSYLRSSNNFIYFSIHLQERERINLGQKIFAACDNKIFLLFFMLKSNKIFHKIILRK